MKLRHLCFLVTSLATLCTCLPTTLNQNYSRRQTSDCPFEAILFNTPMKQAFSNSTLTPREQSGLKTAATSAQETGSTIESRFEFVSPASFRFFDIAIQKGLPESAERLKLEPKSDDSVEFMWFQYGDDLSRAVYMRFDPREPSNIQIDVNRDQNFVSEETYLCNQAGEWFVEMSAEYGPLQNQTSMQRVRIRRDASNSSWQLATAGIRRGKASFNGKLRDAELQDRNANGLWFDAEDRLFVDLNGDGKINRLLERFPCQGMRKIRGEIFAIAGDVAGESISITPVTETGTLIPVIDFSDASAKVVSISGLLGSSAGVGIPINSLDRPIEVPIGDWHVETLRIKILSEQGYFDFAFAKSGSQSLVSIGDSEEKELKLLGSMKLSATVSVTQEASRSSVLLTPNLSTESGCYLVLSKTGKQSASGENRLNAFNNSPQRELEVGSSGFS